MKSQMFPPNHSDNSFEWFRKQNQMIDENFNYPEINQFMNEDQRYYGNTIQPFTQNPTINTQQVPEQSQQIQHAQPMQQAQSTQAQQQSHMIEPSPYGGQQIQSGHYGQLSQEPVLAPQHYTAQNPTAMYNQVYQYDPTYYGGMQSQYPYMAMNPSQFGNQTNYFTSPQNQFGVQSQQAQMLQQGPFTTPPMFAPSTPYPAHPKKLNQQNNNGQSFQFSSILNQFKNSSGSYDVPKMMSTAGQMMNTMNQVGGLFKQIGGLFK